MKKIFYSVSITAMLVVLGSGCGRKNKEEGAAEAQTRLAVRVETVAEREFEQRITVQGTVEAKHFADVAARVDGNLEELHVDVGDAVVAGETVLFQIDSVNHANALAIAERDVDVARASLEVMKATAARVEVEARKALLDFNRFQRLHKDGRVSDSEFEQAEVGRAQAEAGLAIARSQEELSMQQLRKAETALAVAAKNLEDTRGVAPLTGVVSRRLAEPGEQMAPGRVVLRIEDLTVLEVAAFLPARYHALVEVDKTPFRISVNGREPVTCKVTTLAPTINPRLRTFEVRGLLDCGQDAIAPGLMADLSFVFQSRKNIGVPSAAVLNRAGHDVVFVVENDKAVLRKVEIGWNNDGWTEILNGLEPGEAVVVEGQTQLAEGDGVRVL